MSTARSAARLALIVAAVGFSAAASAQTLSLPYSGSGNVSSPSSLFQLSNSGTGKGILSLVPNGTHAVFGRAKGTGVYGEAYFDQASIGVHGMSTLGTGVLGVASNKLGTAVVGRNENTYFNNWGFIGGLYLSPHQYSTIPFPGAGVYGKDELSGTAGALGTPWAGVEGSSGGTYTNIGSLGLADCGVMGEHDNGNQAKLGTLLAGAFATTGGSTPATGMLAFGWAGATGDHPTLYGVFGSTQSGTGVYGVANATTGVNYGVYGRSYSASGYAGYFYGRVHVNGRLSKSSGSFKIDHPLDPANKFLSHSFVESPDMKNIYDGVATLDDRGEAVVEMPDWFDALNRDFRYQLTCIGGFAPVYVAEELVDGVFLIGGGKPGMKVSWQVTGIRQDAYARANPIPVEEDKTEEERGLFLNPEAFGQPKERGIEWLAQCKEKCASDAHKQAAASSAASAAKTNEQK